MQEVSGSIPLGSTNLISQVSEKLSFSRRPACIAAAEAKFSQHGCAGAAKLANPDNARDKSD